jgi:hypothetical protein
VGGDGDGRSSFWRKKTAGRLTGQARLSVRGRRWGRLGRKGEGERWATAGPEIRNGRIQEKNPFKFYLEFEFLANFKNLHKEIPKEF